MAELTHQEAAAFVVALTTAAEANDFITLDAMLRELDPQSAVLVISGLLGSISGLMMQLHRLTGADTAAILKGVGASIASREFPPD